MAAQNINNNAHLMQQPTAGMNLAYPQDYGLDMNNPALYGMYGAATDMNGYAMSTNGYHSGLLGGAMTSYNQPTNPNTDANGSSAQQQNGNAGGSSSNSLADIMSQLQKLQQVVASSTQSISATNPNQQKVNEQQQQLVQNKSLTQQNNDQSVSNSNNQSVQSLNQLQSAATTNQQSPAQAGANNITATVNPLQALAGQAALGMGFPGVMGVQQNPGVMFPGMMPSPLDMQAAAFNPYMMGFPQAQWYPGSGSAAAFHLQGPKNEIKLFVGGLQFSTAEQDLFAYFSKFGQVGDAIVMRDKATGRGRGFGFVRLIFKDDDEAQKMKDVILQTNSDNKGGHYILDKKVDVKSADDYQGKGNPLQQQITAAPGAPLIQKPNPYVIAETKTSDKDPGHVDVTFKYPKTKIFVGGLDFKLTVEELKQHFSQYGEVTDAIILKDIYTGQSRGFGFVSFKDEDVAQNLIKNILVTTINGRKADIKTAEPKLNPFIPQKGPGGQLAPAVIPPYGSKGYDSSRSNSRDRGGRGGRDHGHGSHGHHDRKRKRDDSSESSGRRRSRSRSDRRRKAGRSGKDKDHRRDRDSHKDRDQGKRHHHRDRSPHGNGGGRHRDDSRDRRR